MNTAKSGRRPQNGLVIIAYSEKELDWMPVVKNLEDDGLEFVAHIDNSTTIALVSSMGETYSKSRIESIEHELKRQGFDKVKIKHCVEVRDHLRGKALRMAQGEDEDE